MATPSLSFAAAWTARARYAVCALALPGTLFAQPASPPVVLSPLTAVFPFGNATPASVANRSSVDWIGESIADTVREALMSQGAMTFGRQDIHESFKTLRLVEFSEISQGSVLKLGQSLRADFVMSGTLVFKPAKPLPPPPAADPPPAAATPSTTGKPAVKPPAPKQPAGIPAGPMGTLTIRARISNRKSMVQSPIFEESGPLEDLATMEAHLAWETINFITPSSAPPEAEFRSIRGPVRLDAQENFIRGVLATSPEQREKFFLQAAKVDPHFWRPAFELGRIHLAKKQYREAASWLARVESPPSHRREQKFYLGLAKLNDGEYPAAQDIFTALANDAPTSEVYANLGVAESRRGQMHALESFRWALNANPNDADYHFNFGYMLWKTGQYDVAADRFRAVLDRVPNDPVATRLLGRALQHQGPQTTKAGKDVPTDLNLERIKDTYGRMVLPPASVLENQDGSAPLNEDVQEREQ